VNERPEVAKYFGVGREETPSYVGVTLPIGIYEMACSKFFIAFDETVERLPRRIPRTE
jgi:hypothetical protein